MRWVKTLMNNSSAEMRLRAGTTQWRWLFVRGGEQYDINLAYIDIVVLVLLWSFRFVSTVVDMVSRHLTTGLTAMGVNPWPVVIAAQILAKSHGIRTQSKLLHQVSGCMRREGCQTDVCGFMIKENWKICVRKRIFLMIGDYMRRKWENNGLRVDGDNGDSGKSIGNIRDLGRQRWQRR